PVNADGSTPTNNVVEDGSISIEVPAGTYDFCITNPTANDRIWIASNFCDPGRQNDFVFESGKHYHFLITEHENGDCVLLTISDASNNRSSRTFNIYRDGVQIAANHDESTYTDEFNFVEGQNYCYTVETVCGSGIASEMSNEDCVIVAPFNTYTINATAGENGTITPSGNVSVEEGDSQTFIIAANAGFQIENVLVDGESVGTVETYTFENVTANHTIAVSFSEKPAIEEWDVRFKVYPNPASDQVNIEGENIENITVFNVMGQRMEILKMSAASSYQISTAMFENGVYIFRITTTDGNIVSQRVVISH
ncbi:MAG: DUF2436 domain-containing protein, partial [Bacteroidales bacterium]|nr:DUF2436 domain-containing protein [Bacteroidales bacterium]